jgi:pectin methylesterase-like acyl-CoA thioesterase
MTKLSLACGLALSAALAACSTTPPAAPMASTTAPAASTAAAITTATATKGPKLVCEDANQMGSHMQQHICLTPEQVAERHKESQQAAQDFQNRGHSVSSDGKPPV